MSWNDTAPFLNPSSISLRTTEFRFSNGRCDTVLYFHTISEVLQSTVLGLYPLIFLLTARLGASCFLLTYRSAWVKTQNDPCTSVVKVDNMWITVSTGRKRSLSVM